MGGFCLVVEFAREESVIEPSYGPSESDEDDADWNLLPTELPHVVFWSSTKEANINPDIRLYKSMYRRHSNDYITLAGNMSFIELSKNLIIVLNNIQAII